MKSASVRSQALETLNYKLAVMVAVPSIQSMFDSSSMSNETRRKIIRRLNPGSRFNCNLHSTQRSVFRADDT